MNIRYRVDLTAEERAQLGQLLSAGTCAARRLKRAQILLAADGGASDEDIERTIAASGSTIYRAKRRFGDRLRKAAGRPQTLDAGTSGWRDGQAD